MPVALPAYRFVPSAPNPSVVKAYALSAGVRSSVPLQSPVPFTRSKVSGSWSAAVSVTETRVTSLADCSNVPTMLTEPSGSGRQPETMTTQAATSVGSTHHPLRCMEYPLSEARTPRACETRAVYPASLGHVLHSGATNLHRT